MQSGCCAVPRRAWQQRCGWIHSDREVEKVADGRVGLFAGQLAEVGLPAHNRGDFDAKKVRPDDGLTTQSAPRALTVAA